MATAKRAEPIVLNHNVITSYVRTSGYSWSNLCALHSVKRLVHITYARGIWTGYVIGLLAWAVHALLT